MEKIALENDDIFLIREFLTPEECQELIRFAEDTGFDEAPISTGSGFVMAKQIRSNDRIISDDPELAERLWQRAEPFLPKSWFYRPVVGFNERFRFYRYEKQQHFALHSDGCFERDNGERSQFTFMIYLNEGCTGGDTTFPKSRIRVTPETGTALVFYHHQLHEGTCVEAGVKYVLRTDVMYGPEKSGKYSRLD